MRLVVVALLLMAVAGALGSLPPDASGSVRGVQVTVTDIRGILWLLAALTAAEGMWSVARESKIAAIQHDLRNQAAEQIALKEKANNEASSSREQAKAATSRAESAEARIQELVRTAERSAAERQVERESLQQALRSAELSLKEKERSAGGADSAGVVGFLSLLQEQGRFIDFLMEEITAFPDDKVAGAARFVHGGCRNVVKQYVELLPIHNGDPGKTITIDAPSSPQSIRFVGRAASQFPVTGRLVHRGWKAGKIALPKVAFAQDNGSDGIVITPAEVEVAA